jgi:MarR family 2-MHQ and catechol resistance regulon transcriptional repressor
MTPETFTPYVPSVIDLRQGGYIDVKSSECMRSLFVHLPDSASRISAKNIRLDTTDLVRLLLSVPTMRHGSVTTTASRQSALDRDAAELHAAVADLVRVYQFRDRDRICCHDISVTQCYALETLVQHGPMRLNALAERLFLDKSTTSRVVSTLARKGYVVQRVDATDGRALTLTATRQGQRLCSRITDDLVEQQKELLQDLEPDVRAGVIQVLRRLSRAADARFRSGVRNAAACCAAGSDAPACG